MTSQCTVCHNVYDVTYSPVRPNINILCTYQKKMIFGNVFRSMPDDNDLKNDFVPYEQVKDTISKIEVLKAANANVSSFLPSWADDEYFMQLHKPKGIKKRNVFEASMETGEALLEKESEDKATIESGRAKLNTENGQITHSVPEISGEELDIKTEDVAVNIPSIIEKTRAIVRQDIRVQKLDQDDESVMEETKNVNTSDVNQENKCLQKPVKLQELKQKTKPVKSGLGKSEEHIALKTGKIQKFIPRKLFLSSIETFKLPPDTQHSTKGKGEETKPVKPKPLQNRFICTTGLSPVDEPRVVRPHRTWRDRILRFFGFKR
ncbi:uncharacterized protein LOC130050043 [Ostrea edulis]|uniref:uncharacterized protein LOC130050043 n=1 Tax=Ostrea edulis TaxID=37623 RepID=UPI0024AFDD86|nr:uncharacterized protein LOC130050043 [Ostrea edulis]XP_056004515.1 uncharacterized protein LOC130050043 [Ostrea edulis]